MFTVIYVKKKNIAKIADVIFHTPAYMYYDVLYVVITVFLYIKKDVDIMEKYMSYLEVFL